MEIAIMIFLLIIVLVLNFSLKDKDREKEFYKHRCVKAYKRLYPLDEVRIEQQLSRQFMMGAKK